jgi:hypothetical protein
MFVFYPDKRTQFSLEFRPFAKVDAIKLAVMQLAAQSYRVDI